VKSIRFNQVPNMHGKRSMRFTDVVVWGLRSKMLDQIWRRELADDDVDDCQYDYFSWDCPICEWAFFNGTAPRTHKHEDP
jgi:hypothetical protein